MLSFETGVNFELIGTLIGLAIYNSVLLGLAFPKVVYKKLLDEPVGLEDLREFDPALYTTLTNILKGDADAMELTFVISYDNYGKEETVDLIENGASVRVINDNKQDFVDRYVDWSLNRSVHTQFDRFYKGFYKVVSKESIRVCLVSCELFDSEEIIKLIKGVEELNFRELEKTTKYVGCQRNEAHVEWFWQVIFELTEEQKKKFLMFVSGSDRSPLRGLGQLNFTVTATGLDDSRLPSAHTCFNDMILPRYSSKEILRQKLLQAIENHEGFGLM